MENSTQLIIIGLKALKDNYIWMLRKKGENHAVIVDPGEEKPVIEALTSEKLTLSAILVTHHHWDHTNGAIGLSEKYGVPIFWAKDRHDNEEIILPELGLNFRVLSIPGHTLDHVAYYWQGVLFCGDTLFTAGCGRVFEGTMEQMYAALNRLSQLPEETQIYCGHEYTQANLHFAQWVEPGNKNIVERIHFVDEICAKQLPTVPANLGLEKKTNPFLRCSESSVIKAAERQAGEKLSTPERVFEVLRRWKNTL